MPKGSRSAGLTGTHNSTGNGAAHEADSAQLRLPFYSSGCRLVSNNLGKPLSTCFYLVKPMIKHLLCATLTSIVCAGLLLADSDQTICTRQNKSTLRKCVTQHLRGFDNVCASAAATNVNIPPDTPFLISYKPHSLSHHLGGAKVWVVPAGLLPIPFSCL